jgi:SAM-dependent methyltransferase
MPEMDFLPPLDIMPMASGSFNAESYLAVGREFLGYFIQLGQLAPDARVLELGCGCARMAQPLTSYLQGKGSYEGIDVDARAISWCQEQITPRFPRFRFHHADVYNSTYHRQGKVPPERYRVPFPSAAFDFVFLTSVFTHMLTDGVDNYLEEVARVLRVGGRCLITFFLLNEESTGLIRDGKSRHFFPYRHQSCWVQEALWPESVVAYAEEDTLAQFHRRGLSLYAPVQYGSWCGRQAFVSYQDMIVATKVRRRWFAPWVQRAFRGLFTAKPRLPSFTVDGPTPALNR